MNAYYVAGIPYSDELYHHGIKGQKWGIRRFENEDGTLTEAGRARYRKYRNVDSKADLGYKRFQRLNNVQAHFVSQNKDSIRGYISNTRMATRTKNERKKTDYENEAKEFLRSSKIIKAMNDNYNSLFKSEKTSINSQYRRELIDKGVAYADDYIRNELTRRKAKRNATNKLWDL